METKLNIWSEYNLLFIFIITCTYMYAGGCHILTQAQIYEEDFKREKREKESLQQQLRAVNSGVSHDKFH